MYVIINGICFISISFNLSMDMNELKFKNMKSD
jgi:hypothetical protein